MDNILYVIGKHLYVNLTNRCPCACTFCIRNHTDTMGDSASLWLKTEPAVEEVIRRFEACDLTQYEEVVFCGFGEPLERVDAVCEIARYLRGRSKIRIRINTNGLANCIHGRDVTPELAGLIDIISISLNASNAEEYLKVTRSKFGIQSFEKMLEFTRLAQKYVPRVILSVVDIIGEAEIEKSREICKSTGAEFRVRQYE